ncbi:hypothetical protein N657DRAFT_639540 [Parathielavia appendiculata]|uniref:Uncharacterized protein n=1 Tax=Parathielavia appendiculata TaxID=2587402 RepID=A0AAN6UCE5_9PEZI|nr:hypothetical protein N657DRAFT_639540 [Parathielavia appendiculata]
MRLPSRPPTVSTLFSCSLADQRLTFDSRPPTTLPSPRRPPAGASGSGGRPRPRPGAAPILAVCFAAAADHLAFGRRHALALGRELVGHCPCGQALPPLRRRSRGR